MIKKPVPGYLGLIIKFDKNTCCIYNFLSVKFLHNTKIKMIILDNKKQCLGLIIKFDKNTCCIYNFLSVKFLHNTETGNEQVAFLFCCLLILWV